jgi:hypothetical protein
MTVLLSAALVWIFQLDYQQTNPEFTFCIFHQLTGMNCYGCGFLRGVAACMHFDFHSAWQLNPVNTISIPFVGSIIIHGLLQPCQKKHDEPAI